MSATLKNRIKTVWVLGACIATLASCLGKTTDWDGEFPLEAMVISPEAFKALQDEGSLRALAPEDYIRYGAKLGEISSGLTSGSEHPVMSPSEAEGQIAFAQAQAASVENQKHVVELLASTVPAELLVKSPLNLGSLESKTSREISDLSGTLARFNRSLGKALLRHPLGLIVPSPRAASWYSVDCTGDEDSAVTWQADVSSALFYREHLPKGILRNFDFPLKKKLTCIKDQGPRGTCTAFAMSGALEAEIAIQKGRFVNLSEQDLYSHIRNIWAPDDINDGTPSKVWPMYTGGGYSQPKESFWSYNRSLLRLSGADNEVGPFIHSCDGYPGLDCSIFSGSEQTHCQQKVEFFSAHCSDTTHQARFKCAAGVLDWQGNPHRICGYAGPLHSGEFFRMNGEVDLWKSDSKSDSIDRLIAVLEAGKPAVLSIYATPSFEIPGPNGYVAYTDDKETNRGKHSMLAVGYLSNEELTARLSYNAPLAAGGGYVIIKNSWGPSYGDVGYAYLPTKWLEAYGLSAVVLMGQVETGTK